MIPIDEVCQDGEAKYYAAVLRNNAATRLFASTFIEPAITTPHEPLVVYNVYRADSYRRMESDPSLPPSIKSRLQEHKLDLKSEFTTPCLEGWHVLRTPTPLAGDQLRGVLTAIQERLNADFFSRSQGQMRTIRDNAVMEEVYKI